MPHPFVSQIGKNAHESTNAITTVMLIDGDVYIRTVHWYLLKSAGLATIRSIGSMTGRWWHQLICLITIV